MEWKDLLALVTLVANFAFSLAAFRRAKAAEDRANRAEQHSLRNAILAERERSLADINAMRATWQTQRALMSTFDPSDEGFRTLMNQAIADMDLVEKLVQIRSASIKTDDELIRFRTEVVANLQKQRAQFVVAEKLFAERMEQLKSQRKTPGRPKDDETPRSSRPDR